MRTCRKVESLRTTAMMSISLSFCCWLIEAASTRRSLRNSSGSPCGANTTTNNSNRSSNAARSNNSAGYWRSGTRQGEGEHCRGHGRRLHRRHARQPLHAQAARPSSACSCSSAAPRHLRERRWVLDLDWRRLVHAANTKRVPPVDHSRHVRALLRGHLHVHTKARMNPACARSGKRRRLQRTCSNAAASAAGHTRPLEASGLPASPPACRPYRNAHRQQQKMQQSCTCTPAAAHASPGPSLAGGRPASCCSRPRRSCRARPPRAGRGQHPALPPQGGRGC